MESTTAGSVTDPSQPSNYPLAIPSTNTERPSVKRQREPESSSPRSFNSLDINTTSSPSKSARLALATAQPPVVLTGAAALEDERRRRREEGHSPPAVSENPSHGVLTALLSGGSRAMSRHTEEAQFAPTANMEPSSKPAGGLTAVNAAVPRLEDQEQTQEHSARISGTQVTESPTPMDVDNRMEHGPPEQVAGQDDRPPPGSFSYPGSLHTTTNVSETPVRGMSYPLPSQSQGSPNSSGSKKHKCPYCNTEFTRHHNLKSHLLTHSQEKPYVCTDCQMRFRRLHDLKRHGKLHTGEKPHVCPKCDRSFARGDALARHSKGAGGCAGRRSSMGSFADETDLEGVLAEADDSTMSGMAYHNGEGDSPRRQSLPGASGSHGSGQGEQYANHSRTYPPSGTRPAPTGLYVPNIAPSQTSNSTGSSMPNSMASHTPSTSISSMPVSVPGPGLYSQTGMTESPKPLSPAIQAHEAASSGRPRSPQQTQHPTARRQSELPSPHRGQVRPKLPGLVQSGFGGTVSTLPTTRSPGGDSGNMFAQSDPSVWAYIQTLEEKVKTLTEKVDILDQEVSGFKKQLQTRETTVLN